MLGKTDGRRRRGQEWMRWLDGILDSMDMSLSKLQETVKLRDACVVSLSGSDIWVMLVLFNVLAFLHSLLFKFFEEFEKDQ